MSSATSPVKQVLEGYVAGRVKAAQLVAAVTGAYYRERGAESGERWRPVMEVIEQAHPGIVELAATTDRPGFAVRLAERPFPKEFEAALRKAAESVLVGTQHAAPLQDAPFVPSTPGFVSRLLRTARRLFTAST